MMGLQRQATADAPVRNREHPKYVKVVLIRSFTYWGQTLKNQVNYLD